MRSHVNIKVMGKVQGVFFRASTKEKAHALHITGFVRNEPDDSVYIEAEGEAENLQQFIHWCHKGPEYACVDRCEVNEAALIGYHNFIIQR